MGRPLTSTALCYEAESLIRRHCTGMFAVYNIQQIQQTLATVLSQAGYYKRALECISAARTENLRHRSLSHENYLDIFEIYNQLAADRPEEAKRFADASMGKLSPGKFTFLDAYIVSSHGVTSVYLGRPEQGCAYFERHLGDIARTGILRFKPRLADVLWWSVIPVLAAGLDAAGHPSGRGSPVSAGVFKGKLFPSAKKEVL